MSYYDDKVPFQTKVDPAELVRVYEEWIEELQAELRKAGRQVDRLEHKLLLRSRKLGEARVAARRVAEAWVDTVQGSDEAMFAALNGYEDDMKVRW